MYAMHEERSINYIRTMHIIKRAFERRTADQSKNDDLQLVDAIALNLNSK